MYSPAKKKKQRERKKGLFDANKTMEKSYGQEQQQACPSVHHQTELCPLVINRRWPCGHHTKIEILSSGR